MGKALERFAQRACEPDAGSFEDPHPAERVVDALGGPTFVADRLGNSKSAVVGWYRRSRARCRIPGQHVEAICRLARRLGLPLTAAHIVGEKRIPDEWLRKRRPPGVAYAFDARRIDAAIAREMRIAARGETDPRSAT